MEKCLCGKEIEESVKGKYFVFDIHNEHKKIEFCSLACRIAWVKQKKVGMWFSVAIGIILAVVYLHEMDHPSDATLALPILVLPYYIRHARKSLGRNFNGGVIGEFLTFSRVILASITVVYPVYRFIQEIRLYRRLDKENSILLMEQLVT